MRFNAVAATAGAGKIAQALGLQATDETDSAVTAVESVLARMPLPRRLRDLGVTRESLYLIAEHAMGDWFLQKNPRAVTCVAELTELLDRAW
jgi:alcohol dehydrogenase class IV